MPRILLALFAALLTLPSQGAPATPKKSKISKIRDLTDTVYNTKIVSDFAALVQSSHLDSFLSSRGPFTLFVPTNSAFSKLPAGMFDALMRPENHDELQRVILFHLVNGKSWDAKDLLAQKSLVSCEGSPLPLKISRAGAQFINKAKLTHADIRCSNGILDQIDTLLLPPKLNLVTTPAAAAPTNAPPVANVPPATNAAPMNTNAPPAGMTGSSAATPSDTNAAPPAAQTGARMQ